jgi:hypothetical protein
MLTQSGRSGRRRAASWQISATCPGSAMFLAKRITPPSPNSRASDFNSTGSE